MKKEYGEYEKAMKDFSKKFSIDKTWLEELYIINGKIWDLESDIRRGKEGLLGLEEVGRRAIAIRELNKNRIAVKNRITEATGLGFRDVRMNHASI